MVSDRVRTIINLVAAGFLGGRVLFVGWVAWNGGLALQGRQWGWAAFYAAFALANAYLAWSRIQEINEHGVLGPSPWDRDREDGE